MCVINIFSKYAWVVNEFQKNLDDSMINRSMKSWLEKNDIEMYSTHNEGKSVVAERFIRTLKTKIYKYMTSVLKNVYIDKLDDIVNEYNNTYHRTTKMKHVDVKDNAYINFGKEVYDKDSQFKVGDHVGK